MSEARGPSRFRRAAWPCIAASAVWLPLAGCVQRAEGPELPVDPPAAFSASGDRAVPSAWWTAFGDPQLDALVDEALGENFDLAIAFERLREAKAIADRAGAARFPIVEGFAEAGASLPDAPDDEHLRLGLSAQYEVDLWGRVRSRAEAERYRAEASAAAYQTAAVSLSAEVAQVWYRLVESRSQLELLEGQLETNERVLRLLENRLGAGSVRAVDILRQRQLVAATREQRAVVRADVGVLDHQLAVLLGRPPRRRVELSRETLPPLPPLPATGVPTVLLRRRPDVRQAHLELLAADRDVASAISERFPRLTIGASVATADGAYDLFQDWLLSLAGNLIAPLFDGGERAAEVERTRAVKQQLLYAYAQTALVAFREVEDALVQEEEQRDRLEHLEEQLRLAEDAYERLQLEYFNGVSSYIDVLTALSDQQQLRRDLLAEERALLELRIALYRALAGDVE